MFTRLLKNIYLKVSIILFCGIGLPFFLIGLVEFNQIESELISQAKINISNSNQLLSLAISRALWDYSKENIDPNVKAVMLDELVQKITVLDSNKKNFYTNEKVLSESKYQLELSEKNIFYNDRKIGSIKLEYSLSTIHLKIKKQVKDLLIVRLAQVLATVILLLLFLHFGFIRRINRLSTQANKLVRKNLDDVFIWSEGDIINELGRDIEYARINLKNLFEDVKFKNNELSVLNKDLEVLVKDKSLQIVHSARMAALGEMAAGIAHEINNPLSVITGRSNLLEKTFKENREVSRDELIKNIKTISKMSFRIAKIVKSLRFFSRNSENDIMEKVTIRSLFEDALDLCNESLKNQEIELILMDIPNFQIECRSVQISQVILNLINNSSDAIKSFKDKWIKIEIKIIENKIIEIRITDSGHGISPEVAEKIMHPFFTTKDVDKGTGLGLSISSGIIKDHKGSLFLDQNCQNTCFVISLPMNQEGKNESI